MYFRTCARLKKQRQRIIWSAYSGKIKRFTVRRQLHIYILWMTSFLFFNFCMKWICLIWVINVSENLQNGTAQLPLKRVARSYFTIFWFSLHKWLLSFRIINQWLHEFNFNNYYNIYILIYNIYKKTKTNFWCKSSFLTILIFDIKFNFSLYII